MHPTPTAGSAHAVVDSRNVTFEQAAMPWPPQGAPLAGTPRATDFPLSSEPVETGIWECSPGSWRTVVQGYSELMHFVSGRATITDADGRRLDVGPGVVLFVTDGWEGTWEVHETVRKSYCITRTA